MYFNCQGYLNNKDNIVLLINAWTPLIVLLSETHVSARIELCELNIDGYRLEQTTSNNSRTGGVMALVRCDIGFKIVSINCVDSYVWMLSLEFSFSGIKYLCSVLYHPPQRDDSKFLEWFREFLDQVSDFDGTNIIVGDFNFDLLKQTFYGDKIKNDIYTYGFTQIVKLPTRIASKSQTLIDYIVTNDERLSHRVHLTPKISDHSIISITLDHLKEQAVEIVSYQRSFKNYDCNKLQQELSDSNWDFGVSDVNVLANSFVTTVENILNCMCPRVKVVQKQKYVDKKWITPLIREMMCDRDAAYKRAVASRSEHTWNEYKRKRNNIVNKIRIEKEKYFAETIDLNRHKPKELWKNLKTLLPGRKPVIQSEIIFDTKKVTHEIDIANKFNKYFVDSIDSIIQSIPPATSVSTPEIIRVPNSIFSKFEKISMSKMKQFIKMLKNVGGGENGISKQVLCDAAYAVGDRLLDVINTSLSSGRFPESWKLTSVTPVPKVHNTKCHSEFRPINTVPIYEKLLEICVKEQLLDYCDSHNIIVQEQSGFREGHSCESVVVGVCDDFIRAIDCDNIVLAVFLDFKRAFETIDRRILIRKLSCMGIRNKVLDWFASYLSNRTQRVIYGNCVSETVHVKHGVPQGTVLGPLLFLLYINDMVGVAHKCKIVMFADDTMLYMVGKDLTEMQVEMNHELNNLFSWLCDNKLSLNTNKSKYCLFAKKLKLSSVNINNIKITVNGEKITYDKEIKYLGVILDCNLNFHAHADYVMRKFSKKVGFLTRVSKPLSLQTRLLLYNAIAVPHLQFCSTLLYNLPQYRINQLEKIQNRALRVILKCSYYTPITYMLKVLNMLSVSQKIMFNVNLFVFKLKHNLLPQYICDNFKLFKDVHNYSTRNCTDFILLNRCNTMQMLNSVLYRGLIEFNKLPVNVKNCNNLNEFKYHLKKYILSG